MIACLDLSASSSLLVLILLQNIDFFFAFFFGFSYPYVVYISSGWISSFSSSSSSEEYETRHLKREFKFLRCLRSITSNTPPPSKNLSFDYSKKVATDSSCSFWIYWSSYSTISFLDSSFFWLRDYNLTLSFLPLFTGFLVVLCWFLPI